MTSEFVRSISDLGVDVSSTSTSDLEKLQCLSGPQLLQMVKRYHESGNGAQKSKVLKQSVEAAKTYNVAFMYEGKKNQQSSLENDFYLPKSGRRAGHVDHTAHTKARRLHDEQILARAAHMASVSL